LGNLIFLVGAIALSIVGSVLLWLRYRQPTSFMSSIDDFQAEMTALSAERPAPGATPTAPGLRSSTSMGPHGDRPSSLSDRLRTARNRSSTKPVGRPAGLTAPPPGKARQGSTVKPTAMPTRGNGTGDPERSPDH
jgi:hypothetical protein